MISISEWSPFQLSTEVIAPRSVTLGRSTFESHDT